MKILVSLEVSESDKVKTVETGSLGYTDKEWNNLSEESKQSVLGDWALDIYDQPYWLVEGFEKSKP